MARVEIVLASFTGEVTDREIIYRMFTGGSYHRSPDACRSGTCGQCGFCGHVSHRYDHT